MVRSEPWSGIAGIRRAGVSSFGFGGTNVHVIVSNHGVPENHVARPELPHGGPQVVLDRALAYVELAGDPEVGGALGDQPDDLKLAVTRFSNCGLSCRSYPPLCPPLSSVSSASW